MLEQVSPYNSASPGTRIMMMVSGQRPPLTEILTASSFHMRRPSWYRPCLFRICLGLFEMFRACEMQTLQGPSHGAFSKCHRFKPLVGPSTERSERRNGDTRVDPTQANGQSANRSISERDHLLGMLATSKTSEKSYMPRAVSNSRSASTRKNELYLTASSTSFRIVPLVPPVSDSAGISESRNETHAASK